jgi:dTDP-4-dehydrorhamnose 3,5-epimerase
MPFYFKRLAISEVILIEPEIFRDERGFFAETYKYSDFAQIGIKEHFVQDNYSRSIRGVLRGLHYQKNPNAQGKIVQCIKGNVFDAAVDIRKGSPTFGQCVSVELSEYNNLILYVPPAFAHGFVVLSEEAYVVYKCTREYSQEHDRGIIWNDPSIGIQWPINDPIVSEKDKRHPALKDADNNFKYITPLNPSLTKGVLGGDWQDKP